MSEAQIKLLRDKEAITLYDMLEMNLPIDKYIETKSNKYPTDIDHFNPKSKSYIEDPRTEKDVQ